MILYSCFTMVYLFIWRGVGYFKKKKYFESNDTIRKLIPSFVTKFHQISLIQSSERFYEIKIINTLITTTLMTFKKNRQIPILITAILRTVLSNKI